METFHIPSQQDGLELGVLCTQPSDKPKGIVQISHGMSEHKERYLPFMEFLSSHGFICVIHDHRGHGESVKSPEDYGYFYQNGAKAVVEDLYQITRWSKARYPNLPLYLFGHSMGSLIVRVYTKRYDNAIDGLLVCGSPSENKLAGVAKGLVHCMAAQKGEHYRSQMIQNLVFGSSNQAFSNSSSQNAWICSDPEVVRAYDKSPLCGFTFTLNGFDALFSLVQQAYSPKGWQLQHPSLPVFFLVGWEDPCRITDKKFLQAVRFMRDRGYGNISYKVYGGQRHEILNDTQKEQVFADVLAWLLQQNKP